MAHYVTIFRVDDEGYGEIQIGGIRCGVMPIWMIPAANMDRVTQGSLTEQELREYLVIEKAVQIFASAEHVHDVIPEEKN